MNVQLGLASRVALQSLRTADEDLQRSGLRLATGLRVTSARDDPSRWSIANQHRGHSLTLGAVLGSLRRGASALDLAMAAGETVQDLLIQMKAKALASLDVSLDAASREELNDEFKALRDQITRTVDAAEFAGINLVTVGARDREVLAWHSAGTASTQQPAPTVPPASPPPPPGNVGGNGGGNAGGNGNGNGNAGGGGNGNAGGNGKGKATGAGKGASGGNAAQQLAAAPAASGAAGVASGSLTASSIATITIPAAELNLAGPNVVIGSTASIETVSQAAELLGAVDTSIVNVSRALGRFGTAASAVQIRQEFVIKARNGLDVSVGRLVDADLTREAASLRAAETRKSLALQSLAISNKAPALLLALFPPGASH